MASRPTAQFSLPVPIERHYEAYCARVSEAPTVIVLVLHDLTAIRRSEQMRADFVANASHELRTPLAAVSGFIDTLRGHAKDDETAREKFLDIMSVEAARMRRLIDDLLSLTRIELNEHVPPRGRGRSGRCGARCGGGAAAAARSRPASPSTLRRRPGLPPWWATATS